MTTQDVAPALSKQASAFSRRDAPELLSENSALKQEGAGNAGCPMHPQPRVRFVVLVCTRVFTAEAPETSGIPHAMVLRLIRAVPGDRALLPPSSAGKSRDLNASVGASGPHDFAVRISTARLATPLRPPHPAPNVRDDREAPLLWVRDGGKNTHFLIFGKRNIRARRAD